MKIVFFACQQIGVDCIKYALSRGVEVPVVYTYELIMDKTYGYDSVSKCCKELNIPCVVNSNSDGNKLGECEPDLIVSAYYRKILKPDIFEFPKMGTLNIHPSMLPEYRGPIPTVWALLHGQNKTGVTLHYIDKGVDTGDIVFQQEVPISDQDTGYLLYEKCMRVGVDLFKKVIENLILGKELPRRLQPLGGSYYGSMADNMRLVNWKSVCEDIVNQARTFTRPYMGLEAKILNKRVIIWKASKVDVPSFPVQKPGRIVEIRDNRLIVSAADGFVSLDEYEFFPQLTEVEREVYFRTGLNFS